MPSLQISPISYCSQVAPPSTVTDCTARWAIPADAECLAEHLSQTTNYPRNRAVLVANASRPTSHQTDRGELCPMRCANRESQL